MNKQLEEAFDEIDAAVFSGDTFFDINNLAKLRYYIERWEKETMGCNRCQYEGNIINKCTFCKKALDEKANYFVLKEEAEDEPSF